MTNLVIRVKAEGVLPPNHFSPSSWPGPGLYKFAGALYLVGTVVTMLPSGAELVEELPPPQAAPQDPAFLLKLVAISQRPELAKDLT